MSEKARIVGIDLGTTHCALCWVDPSLGAGAPVVDFAVTQLVRPGEVSARPLLPSCVYLPGAHELPPESLALPWPEEPPGARTTGGAGHGPRVVGELARWQGAKVPTRLVSSAKSWLCHPGVDRQAPILPWGAGAEVDKLSPVEAQALLLRHLAQAWRQQHPDAPLEAQEVVVTVPASFDEAARALTVSAARQAGLQRFTLLEEPQAAFYDFTARHRGPALGKALGDVRLVLVVDVGGGTTDFTLVQTAVLPEGPVLRRIAVGDHLMLGGDNMDALVARRAEEKLTQAGKKLGAAQWTELLQGARAAKEVLLGASPPERYTLSVAGGGSRLLGGTLTAELSRAEVEEAVVEGFFPRAAGDESPRRGGRMAIQELGLPYAQDPAVTRHLVAFLRLHAEAGHAALRGELPKVALAGPAGAGGGDAWSAQAAAARAKGGQPPSPGDVEAGARLTQGASGAGAPDALPRPDALLLNGGVFNSPVLAREIVARISALWPEQPPIPLLPHSSLDLAVARGAAYYGLARRGFGLRIGGGAARAYYVGLASSPSGEELQTPGACLIPRGFDEGTEVDLPGRGFQLTLGRPVQFQLYSTTSDRIDKPGDVVDLSGEAFRPLPPIHTILQGSTAKEGVVPVHLRAALTEIGTLELSCVSQASDERWRLEFELRGAQAQDRITVTESMPARFAEAKDAVVRVYGTKPLPVEMRDVKGLPRHLEKILGPREGWRVPVLRELWSALYAGAPKRRRTADHERILYHLLGYTLRPGFGYPLDAWRAEQTFGLFGQELGHHTDKSVWIEYWVMWRRIAGGLSEDAQAAVHAYLRPHLERRVPPDAKPQGKQKGIQPEGLDEMVRTAAALEHLSAAHKEELGGWVLSRLLHPQTQGGPWAWAMGRLGTRQPLYGSSHRVVSPEAAARWMDGLIGLGLSKVDGGAFAVAQLARLTGDRTRDLDEDARARAISALRAAKAPDTWLRMVTEVSALEAADEARALGDTLPQGLMLR